MTLNEQVFRPGTVQFTVTKDYLYNFEKDNPTLEPLLKTLLRAYDGIFDYPSFVSELMIAQLEKKDVEDIKIQLKELNDRGIIEYLPRKDSPQLYFVVNRIKTEELFINKVAYNQRKEKFINRVKQIIAYTLDDIKCRSRIIGSYFGDEALKSCGICDNCLRQRAETLSKEDFEIIYSKIKYITEKKAVHIKELLTKLNGIKKEKAWKVIEFLQAENKIEMDSKGWIRLKQPLRF